MKSEIEDNGKYPHRNYYQQKDWKYVVCKNCLIILLIIEVFYEWGERKQELLFLNSRENLIVWG